MCNRLTLEETGLPFPAPRGCLGALLALYLVLFDSGNTAAATHVDNSAHRDEAARRRERLHDVAIEYDRVTRFTPKGRDPDPTAVGDSVRVEVVSGTSNARYTFRFLNGQAYYGSRALPGGDGNAADSALEREAFSLSRERVEFLWRKHNLWFDEGRITIGEWLPTDTVIDYILGLRAYAEAQWLSADDWKGFDVTSPEGVLEMSLKRDASPLTHAWTVDPARDYAIVRYAVIYNGGVSIDARADDFRVVDDMQLPHLVTWSAYGPDGIKAGPVSSAELTVSEYRLGDPKNTEDSFLLEWPEGAVVMDARNDAVIRVRDGPRVLDDAYLQSLARGQTALARDDPSRGGRLWFVAATVGMALALALCFLVRRLRRGAS